LIPSLNSGSNRVENDGEVYNLRMLPSVAGFLVQNTTIFFIKFMDLVNMMRTLCYQSALDQPWCELGDIVLGSEVLNILKKLIFRDTDKGVLDSRSRQQLLQVKLTTHLLSSDIFSQCGHTFLTTAQVCEDRSFAPFIVGDFARSFGWGTLQTRK
jgi:hypothetical protein